MVKKTRICISWVPDGAKNKINFRKTEMREQTEKRQKHPKSCLALGIKCSQISASTKILRSDGTKDVSKSLSCAEYKMFTYFCKCFQVLSCAGYKMFAYFCKYKDIQIRQN